MRGLDRKPGGGSLVQALADDRAGALVPGKRTLTEQLPGDPRPVYLFVTGL
jgi:hypothetical protein